jgi:hypothetical protein
MAQVLFVCPTYPRPDGVGLAMRAGVSLDGLARRHDVSVAVVRWADDGGSDAMRWTRERARAAALIPHAGDPRSSMTWLHTRRGRAVAASEPPELVRLVPPVVSDRIADTFDTTFDAVVVMRAYLAGAVVSFLEAGVPAVLDADDDEARTARSLTALGGGFGDQAVSYDAFQRTVFPWFDRVLFASIDDARPPFGHLPNSVRLPPAPLAPPPRAPGEPLELLFVGDPGYEPNRDAVEQLTQRIVPAITRGGEEVILHRPPRFEPLPPYYAKAHVALAPLRAGGGTRIKILEAFAYGCPVVATPTGASGLDVADGEQLVITDSDDDAEDFAAEVVALARDEGRRAVLAERGRVFVEAHHDASVVGDQLAALVDDVARHARTRGNGPADGGAVP